MITYLKSPLGIEIILVLPTIPRQFVPTGRPFDFSISDYYISGANYTVGKMPEWLIFNEQTGSLAGTPRVSDMGFETIPLDSSSNADVIYGRTELNLVVLSYPLTISGALAAASVGISAGVFYAID